MDLCRNRIQKESYRRSEAYVKDAHATDAVGMQLSKAGVRLAALLNCAL
jgi:hypothetical protein